MIFGTLEQALHDQKRWLRVLHVDPDRLEQKLRQRLEAVGLRKLSRQIGAEPGIELSVFRICNNEVARQIRQPLESVVFAQVMEYGVKISAERETVEDAASYILLELNAIGEDLLKDHDNKLLKVVKRLLKEFLRN